jgi:CBS domain-containing protein
MEDGMRASDIMTRAVLTIAPDATIGEAVRLMLDRRISGLPVVDAAGTLVGIVTEGDFLRRTEFGTERKRSRWLEFLLGPGRMAEEFVHASGRKVDEVMTDIVETVDEDAPLVKIVDLMERRRIKRLPVARDGKVVGIVTRANLLGALAGLTLEKRAASVADANIRERLIAELKGQSWAPLALIDVEVADGVVRFTGAVTDERERTALRVAAENLPGVKKVEDHLIWVEPTTGMIFRSPEDAVPASS